MTAQERFCILGYEESQETQRPRTGDFFHPSRRLSVVVMMQPTQDGALADGTAHDSRSSRPRDLLLDSLMRSLTIVEGDILLQNPLDLTSANQ